MKKVKQKILKEVAQDSLGCLSQKPCKVFALIDFFCPVYDGSMIRFLIVHYTKCEQFKIILKFLYLLHVRNT